MRRLVIGLIGVLAIWSLWSPAAVDAFPEAGNACFQLSPFLDVIDLHLKQPDPTEYFFAFGVVWTGALEGEVIYQVFGGGTAYGNAPAQLIGLHFSASHTTEFFQGNPLCYLHATVNPGTLTGPWTANCQGPNPALVIAGELVHVPCGAPLLVSVAQQNLGGRLAGE